MNTTTSYPDSLSRCKVPFGRLLALVLFPLLLLGFTACTDDADEADVANGSTESGDVVESSVDCPDPIPPLEGRPSRDEERARGQAVEARCHALTLDECDTCGCEVYTLQVLDVENECIGNVRMTCQEQELYAEEYRCWESDDERWLACTLEALQAPKPDGWTLVADAERDQAGSDAYYLEIQPRFRDASSCEPQIEVDEYGEIISPVGNE